MQLDFSTKAGTLALLNGKIKSASIPISESFTYCEWLRDSAGCSKRLGKIFAEDLMIVRSSCGREDSAEFSNAGAFLSLSNVTRDGLADAVDAVLQFVCCCAAAVVVCRVLNHLLWSSVSELSLCCPR